jgi:hypothetical protein
LLAIEALQETKKLRMRSTYLQKDETLHSYSSRMSGAATISSPGSTGSRPMARGGLRPFPYSSPLLTPVTNSRAHCWTRENHLFRSHTDVEDATRQGGRALVTPARTVGEGPERKFLSGLEYDLGSGFAPHPNFLRWMEEQIKSGVRQFNNSLSGGTTSTEAEDDAWSPEWAL